MFTNGIPFSHDRLEEAARNAPEVVDTTFVRVIVTRISQNRTIELKFNTIIRTVIVSIPQ